MIATPFGSKPAQDLVATDFALSPLWAGNCEPDDIDEIVRWCIPELVVRVALDEAGWKDDYFFPLPIGAAEASWMRGKLFSARIVTASGAELDGYVGETRSYVVAFTQDKQFVLATQLSDQLRGFASATREVSPFPVRVTNRVTGKHWTHSPV